MNIYNSNALISTTLTADTQCTKQLNCTTFTENKKKRQKIKKHRTSKHKIPGSLYISKHHSCRHVYKKQPQFSLRGEQIPPTENGRGEPMYARPRTPLGNGAYVNKCAIQNLRYFGSRLKTCHNI